VASHRFKAFVVITSTYVVHKERISSMKLYAGNLPDNITEAELHREFEVFGSVESVSIVTDKYNGQSRGFGFVEMPVKAEGQEAIEGLSGKMLNERTLVVNEARPRTGGQRDGRSSSGGRGSGYRGSGNRGRY
jgi:RNA recognition motif-containing protein